MFKKKYIVIYYNILNNNIYKMKQPKSTTIVLIRMISTIVEKILKFLSFLENAIKRHIIYNNILIVIDRSNGQPH